MNASKAAGSTRPFSTSSDSSAFTRTSVAAGRSCPLWPWEGYLPLTRLLLIMRLQAGKNGRPRRSPEQGTIRAHCRWRANRERLFASITSSPAPWNLSVGAEDAQDFFGIAGHGQRQGEQKPSLLGIEIVGDEEAGFTLLAAAEGPSRAGAGRLHDDDAIARSLGQRLDLARGAETGGKSGGA